MPVFAFALGLMGTAVVVRLCVREVQRANAEAGAARERPSVEPVDRAALPTLKADPNTGEYRPD